MKRIFIVGCQRSGTTLLQSLLAAHSQVISFTESHFFYKGFWPLSGKHYLLKSGTKKRVYNFLSENAILLDNNQWLWPEKRGGIIVAQKTAHQLIELLDQCARYRHSEAWVEKTPTNIFFIPLLTQIAPAACFIHLIRRPEAVLPSMLKASRQWGRPKGYLESSLHWNLALRISEKYVAHPAHYFLSYEDLTNNPISQLKPLFEWLGLSWESQILNNYKIAAQDIMCPYEVWRKVDSTIKNKNKTSFNELPWLVRFIIKITKSYRRLDNIFRVTV